MTKKQGIVSNIDVRVDWQLTKTDDEFISTLHKNIQSSSRGPRTFRGEKVTKQEYQKIFQTVLNYVANIDLGKAELQVQKQEISNAQFYMLLSFFYPHGGCGIAIGGS